MLFMFNMERRMKMFIGDLVRLKTDVIRVGSKEEMDFIENAKKRRLDMACYWDRR